MTKEEAKDYAKKMTYRDAVYNALQGRSIPYRKATLIKLYELLDMIESQESEDKLDGDPIDIDKAVEPERKPGKWIHVGDGGYCSECGHDMPWFFVNWNYVPQETPFCPNCDAKMEVDG